MITSAAMADTIRGDGLVRTDRALAALVEDPAELRQARVRFSKPPPSYTSQQSHNSTRSQSPDPPSKEQQRREELKWRLKEEYWASYPSNQFETQVSQERDRIFEANKNRTCRVPVGTDFYELAEENVKNRWVEQNIWNEKWGNENPFNNGRPWGRWKHEELLEPESKSEAGTEPNAVSLFTSSPKRRHAVSRRSKAGKKPAHIADRQPFRKREHDASRPFYQFFDQVSRERERIQDEMNLSGSHSPAFYGLKARTATHTPADEVPAQGISDVERATTQTPADIYTCAYERVKDTWVRTGIWNRKWGILPGLSWKHEKPLQEMLDEEMGDDNILLQADRHEHDEQGTQKAPPTSISGSSIPTESNHEASGTFNVSQHESQAAVSSKVLGNNGYVSLVKSPTHDIWYSSSKMSSPSAVPSGLDGFSEEPPQAIDLAGSSSGSINHSSAVSHSRDRQAENQWSPRFPRRTRRQRERSIFEAGWQQPRTERNALGPTHLSKVYKARKEHTSSFLRRTKVSEFQTVSTNVHPVLPVAAPAPLRRSKRLEEAECKLKAARTDIAATAQQEGGSRSGLRQTPARPKPAGSGKPQGVLKARPSTARPRMKLGR